MPVLSVEHLRKTFTIHARDRQITAIDDLSFAVEAGSLTALVGPSGAGKSSAMKCIYRSYLPDAGRMLLSVGEGAIDMAAADDHQIIELRRTTIGFVTQFLHCLPRVPAIDVVAEPLVRSGTDAASARDRAAELLAQLAVPEALWQLSPTTFSGGEKQRINLARGFARPNRLLLLDEPTASLDPATAERVVTLINDARANGTALVGIMHDPKLVERLADQVVTVQAPQATEAACSTP